MSQRQHLLALLLLLTFASAIWSQETPPAEDKSVEAAKDASPKFSATLLLIKSDWSKSPHAKEIEAELREALKDASVPKELLDKLPASGPEILFAPEVVAFYSAEHFAELVEWLAARELLKSQEPFVVAAESFIEVGTFSTVLEIAKDEKFIELPPLPTDKQPFVSQQPKLLWSLVVEPFGFLPAIDKVKDVLSRFDLDKDGFISQEEAKRSDWDPPYLDSDFDKDDRLSSKELYERYALKLGSPGKPLTRDTALVNVLKIVAIQETLRGEPGPGKRIINDQSISTFQVRRDRVAIANGFPTIQEARFRLAAQAKGFGAIVAIAFAEAPEGKAQPRLHLPDSVQKPNIRYDPQLAWTGAEAGDASAAIPQAAVTKIIHLQHALATDLRDTLQQLYPDDLKLVVDKRTNAIIVSGPEPKLTELEAIVVRLDNEPGSAAEDKSSAPHPGGTVADLNQQYTDAEQAAAALAKEAKPQKDKLRTAVAKAFDLRQKLLQAELAEFRQRTARIEQSLKQREGIKQQIIERRVEDLLKPGLEWNGAEATAKQSPAKAAATSRPSPEQAARQEGAVRLQKLELQQAEALLRVAEAELNGAVTANRKNPNTVPQKEIIRLQAQLDIAKLGVEKARIMLDLFRHGVPDEKSTDSPAADRATRIKLLELDVKQARLELEPVQTNYQYHSELYQAGSSSLRYSDLTEAKLAVTRAQAKLDKAQLLLDAELQSALPDGTGDERAR